MYLHIGKNIVLDDKTIIGIFDLESIKNSSEDFLENLEKETPKNNEEEDKTIILTQSNKKFKGYITNISSITLEKRAINGGFNG